MKNLMTSNLAVGMLLAAFTSVGAEPVPATAPGLKPASYQVRNVRYGELLRPENADGADGVRIVLYSPQPWKCMTWKIQPAGESAFSLQNHFTSKTFKAQEPAAGSASALAVLQVPWGKNPADRPGWKIERLTGDLHKITDAKTGQALTAVKAADGYSVRVVLQPWTGGDEQKWELIETDPSKLTM